MADLKEVFVPGGMPSYTYQAREELQLENSLLNALHRVRKFVAVAGPTKSGKTVLVRRVVPPGDGIWIEGAHIPSIDAFWTAVLAGLGIASPSSQAKAKAVDTTTESELTAGFRPAGIGAEGKVKEITKTASSVTQTTTLQSSNAQSAVAGLLAAKKTLVIDDFHYVDAEVQTALVRGLKQAVFDGLSVVLILIPHRMHQAASAEMDVDGRTQTVAIPEWQSKELFAIAESGARELAVRMHATTIETMVQESFQSPHLMQDFCSLVCSDNNVWRTNTGALKTLVFVQGKEEFFERFATTISPETFRALQRGLERTNRMERALKSGGTCDTYEAVLLALQRLNVMSPVRWGELRRSLQDILVDEPQQHEVTRVLEKMDEIAKARDGEPVLDYVKEQRELHLVDPFFRFYVRWGSLVSK
jgi:hypothetical protein